MSEEPMAAEEYTAEFRQKVELELDKMAEIANQLMATRPEFKLLVNSMIAARQLYTTCVYELELLCQNMEQFQPEEPLTTEPQLTMFREILTNASAVQAQQPFDERTLFQNLTETVFPWLKQIVANHTVVQNRERKQIAEEREQVRVATPINLGVQFFAHQDGVDDWKLPRHRPVLFVGQTHVLRWLFQFIQEQALRADSGVRQAVRLTETDEVSSDPRLLLVSKSRWANCAQTNSSFQRIYDATIFPALADPVDLLLVDNLLLAYPGFAQAPRTTVANEAQRKLKNWTDKAGALLVGALPLQRPLRADELNTPEYETLRMHNVIRGVDAVETETGYRIRAGNHVVADISREALEAHKPSLIIQ